MLPCNKTMPQSQVHGLAFLKFWTRLFHIIIRTCCQVKTYSKRHHSANCDVYKVLSTFVEGVDKVWILISWTTAVRCRERTTKRTKFGWKIKRQIPNQLYNHEWLFPGRALLKTRPGLNAIISNDTRKETNQGKG